MSVSIGCAINVYQDNNALPGLLENASQFFDDIFVIHASHGMKRSTDGTIETLEKWGIRHIFEDIAQGFGSVRTKVLHGLTTEWGMILDADERFMATHKVLHCEGSEKYPENPDPRNKVIIHDPLYNQGKMLRDVICISNIDAIVSCRRHWMDFTFTRPFQNFHNIPDHQMRIMRNRDYIGFRPERKMHELAVNFKTGGEPEAWRCQSTSRGIFHDHFHCFFKPMEADQNAEDMEIYKALDQKGTENMWLNAAEGVK